MKPLKLILIMLLFTSCVSRVVEKECCEIKFSNFYSSKINLSTAIYTIKMSITNKYDYNIFIDKFNLILYMNGSSVASLINMNKSEVIFGHQTKVFKFKIKIPASKLEQVIWHRTFNSLSVRGDVRVNLPMGNAIIPIEKGVER